MLGTQDSIRDKEANGLSIECPVQAAVIITHI